MPKGGSKAAELGCGSGYITLELARRFFIDIKGIDILADSVTAAQENLLQNRNILKGTVEFIHCDIKEARERLGTNSFDFVVTNPPYYKTTSGRISPSKEKQIATSEYMHSFNEWIETARRLLKPFGILYLSFIPERLCECVETLRQNKLEPKILQFVHPQKEKPAAVILIRSIKAAKSGLMVRPPLFLKT